MRRGLCILLALLMLVTSLAVSADKVYAWGDLNDDKFVNAVDALLVLQYAVGKTTLSEQAVSVANVSSTGVNANDIIDAVDALLILQYSVNIITIFPAEKASNMQPEERYYYELDQVYGVTGEDFEDTTATIDVDNAKDVINTLGQLPDDTDIDGHKLNSEGNVIYNRISAEAKKNGTLTQYNTSAKTKGELRLSDGTTLAYEVPTQVTAYSAVPLTYTIQGGSNASHVQLVATTYEEPDRVPSDMKKYYENTMPDDVNISVSYDGYIQTKDYDAAKLSSWSANIKDDRMGTEYPPYSVTDLTCSGTIPSGIETWLQFTFTNTGNTILKGDGQGYFNLSPRLYKKNDSGNWDYVAMNDNYAYRLFDPLYPGESRQIWVKFGNGNYQSFPEGEYRMYLNGELANEQNVPNWIVMYIGGRMVTQTTFDFIAQKNASITKPNDVVTKKMTPVIRNSWLGVYEEFQTSFHTFYHVANYNGKQDTLYFQPAPWDKTLTLRVISEDTGAMEMVTIPLSVETDSISISLNPYNQNYVVKEDGTREPILGTQHMADMRGNNQDYYDPMYILVNDFKDMQEAGINYLTSTMAFNYQLGAGILANTATRIMMDFASVLGFKVEGYGNYTYESSINQSAITRGYAKVDSSVGTNKMNGVLNSWIYDRFGDVEWATPEGITPIAQEDSRGWMTIDHDWRMDLDNATVKAYRQWLKEAYGTIEKVNAAYGSRFASFDEIDPREDGKLDSNYYNFTDTSIFKIYHERSKAMRELDLFRTINRIRDYRESLQFTQVENAQMLARYEGSPIITAGLKATTKNPHYRENYYQMYRAALVGELVGASDSIFGTSTYQNTPFTPSETYELTKHATLAGINVMNYHMGYREQIYNTFYGDGKADVNLHLADSDMVVTAIATASALFPAFKATYEAGGAPGVMWMDYYCAGYVTSTKYKELQFYTSKIKEMLATEEGKAWATNFDATGSLVNQNANHVFSYDPDYLKAAYNSVERRDKFNLKR